MTYKGRANNFTVIADEFTPDELIRWDEDLHLSFLTTGRWINTGMVTPIVTKGVSEQSSDEPESR